MNFAKCCQGMYDAVLFACGALRYFVISQVILPLICVQSASLIHDIAACIVII